MRIKIIAFLLALCFGSTAYAQLEIFICGGANSAPTDCRAHGTSPTVGSGADQVVVRDANGENVLRLPVNPSVPLNTPSGWSGPSSPPSTSTPTVTYTCVSGAYSGTGSSPSAACGALLTTTNPLNAPGASDTLAGCSGAVCNFDRTYHPSNATGSYSITTSSASTCVPGYTLSGSVCNLSDASLVPKPSDGKIGVTRTSNTFSGDSQDADNVANVPPVSISGSTVTMALDTSRTLTVTIDGAGKTSVALSTAGGSNTQVQTTNIGTPGSGAKVEGTVTQTFTGTGTATSSTPNSKTDTSCASGDCATESTLKGIKDKLTSGVAQDEKESTWSAERSSLSAAQSSTQSAIDALMAKGTVASASGNGADLNTALGNLNLPSTAPSQSSFWGAWFPAPAACVSTALGGSGRFTGLSMDLCPVVNGLRPILEWGLWLLTALVIYQSWFGGSRQRSSESS
jgi:hypothetical protein